MRTVGIVTGVATLIAGVVTPIGMAASPAAAEGCTAQQVAVVVDYGSLGAPLAQACSPAAGNAATLFGAAGFQLRYAQQVPGAVCQVDSQPTDTPCQQMPPGNAYWGLFWSDGSTSRWTYSAFGVQSLSVPAGGSVAFVWQGSTTQRFPGVAPVVTRANVGPPPMKEHSKRPRPSAVAKPTSASATPAKPSASAGATGSATPTPVASPSATSPVASPSASGGVVTFTEAPSPSATASPHPASANTESGGGLPAWVPVGLIGVLLLGAGVIAAVRRRA